MAVAGTARDRGAAVQPSRGQGRSLRHGGEEVERTRWVLRLVHVVVSGGDRQGRERSPAARVGSNRKHAPRWGGLRAARTCDREAPRVAGPAARRGDRVEKHLGAGRAALTCSSLAFVIGLHSDPALQPLRVVFTAGTACGWRRRGVLPVSLV